MVMLRNEEVLVYANEARTILKVTDTGSADGLGMVLRHENLLYDIIQGNMLGKATLDRKKWSYCMI